MGGGMSKKAFWLQGKGPEANFKRDHFLLIFKNDRPECSEIERKKNSSWCQVNEFSQTFILQKSACIK